mmetsp:Transcript_11482/g.47783  ORF Transcript_11482/g.47783 Transcript_11482/m.47783 type:complete len:143 (-) Transcript_11482:1847-2275(-)
MASRDAAVGQTSGADVRNSLYKRFDDRVNNIVTSLQNIVDAASIEDKATNAVGEYQTDVEASHIAQSFEDILRLLSEIEIAAITQDTMASMQELEKNILPLYQNIYISTDQALKSLKMSVDTMLAELEKHYYTSQCSIPIVP